MRSRNISCCFTGHRPEKLPWGTDEGDPRCMALKGRLRDALEAAYEDGIRHFICGMARGCDFYFAEEVLQLRQGKGDVTLEAALPCLTQAGAWPERDRERWQRLVSLCDLETVVQQEYTPYCMFRRNRYMVDHSSLLIAVYNGGGGGTRYTLEYALRQQVPFIDIPLEE